MVSEIYKPCMSRTRLDDDESKTKDLQEEKQEKSKPKHDESLKLDQNHSKSDDQQQDIPKKTSDPPSTNKEGGSESSSQPTEKIQDSAVESTKDVVKLQPSTTQVETLPQTVSVPFENIQVQASEEKVPRAVSNQPQQHGISNPELDIPTSDSLLKLDSEIEKLRLREEPEPAPVIKLDEHIKFYHKQEQFLESIQKWVARNVDNNQNEPIQEQQPINSEDELLVRQQELMQKENAFRDWMNKNTFPKPNDDVQNPTGEGNQSQANTPLSTNAQVAVGVAAAAGLFLAFKALT